MCFCKWLEIPVIELCRPWTGGLGKREVGENRGHMDLWSCHWRGCPAGGQLCGPEPGAAGVMRGAGASRSVQLCRASCLGCCLEAEAQRGHHGHVGRAGALLLEGFHCKSFWHALEALPVCMQWGPHLVEGNGRVSE